MKKISLMLALAGIGAATVMTACGGSGTEAKKPTKAEQCASLTNDCLIGEWAVNGFGKVESGAIVMYEGVYNYSAVPGTLTFKDDGRFSYFPPASSSIGSDIDCHASYGTWTLAGNSLTLSSTSICAQGKTTVTPTIIVGATQVEMAFDKMWFLKNESDESSVRTEYVEVFSISAQ